MRIERQGFALIAVLWLIATLTSLVGLSIAATRLGQRTTINRIVLTRGRWAAEACLAIVQARWSQGRLADTATTDLGRRMRCAWVVQDPSARIDFNTADPEVLTGLGASQRFIEALLERRRQGSIDDLRQLHKLSGWESQWDSLGTVAGPGVINLTTASAMVLRALPGLTPEAVQGILSRRRIGRPYSSLDALAADLSPPSRTALLARYADLRRITSFTARQLLVTATGWVEGEPPRATIELIVVPLPDRLAVVRRRMW